MEYAAEAFSDEASEIHQMILPAIMRVSPKSSELKIRFYYISTIAVSKSHFLNVYILFNMS